MTSRRRLLLVGAAALALTMIVVGTTAEAGRRTRIVETAEGSCFATATRLGDAQRQFRASCPGQPQVDCDRGRDGWTCSDQQIATIIVRDRDRDARTPEAGPDPTAPSQPSDPSTAPERTSTTGGESGPSPQPSSIPSSSAAPPTTGSTPATSTIVRTTPSTTARTETTARPSTTVRPSTTARPPTSARTVTTARPPATSPTAPAPAPAPVGTRDPIEYPFAWNSPWNLPLGSGARYLPADIEPPGWGPGIDEDVLFLDPDAPLRRINRTTVGWERTPTRCGGLVAGVFQFGGDALPVTPGFTTEPTYTNNTPNHAGAFLEPDGRTIRQSQPVHVCSDGRVVTKVDYPDDDIISGDGIRGAHGGSGMSSLGGTLRLHDLEKGEINHALKLTIQAARYLSQNEGGYRWPAWKADSYVNAPPTASCYYGGTNPAVRMGALLALPPDFDTDALDTELGQMLGDALQTYGGYVVDDVCWDKFLIATEWGPQGRVTDEVERRWGIEMQSREKATCTSSTPNCRYARDIGAIVDALHVIDNNTPSTPGGPGTRIAPCAPPFRDGTGAPPAGSVCSR
ncbi:MAG: hypothetical protein AAF467_17970 [Actinomycetota bacterium]